MASATKKLKVRRDIAKARRAKKRKNFIKLNGSTAKNLPLNQPNNNEKKQLSA